MLMSAGERLSEARGGDCAAILGLNRARARRFDSDRLAVDADLAVADTDAVTRQSDHPLDPDLRAIARPAEDDDVAALGKSRKNALRVRENKESWKGCAAVTVRIFHRQQL